MTRRGTVALVVGAGLSVVAVVASVLASGSGSSARTPRYGTSSRMVRSSVFAGRAASSSSPSSSASPSSPVAAPMTPVMRAALASGSLRRVAIPPTTSHFRTRTPLVWLPPAARSHPSERFPVLELLVGTTGAPAQWEDRGYLTRRMSAVAAQHHGRTPVVVVVDENGFATTDSECVDRRHGDVETYLTVDVPRWIRAHLPVKAGRGNFAIAGLSEGGTCALMLALRHPSVWQTFDDISGLARPTVGEDDDRARTIRLLFGGSAAAFDAHDPTYLLRKHRYPTTRGELYYGTSDRKVVRDVRVLLPLLRRAGVGTRVAAQSGAHSWTVFGGGLSSFLGWWYRG